MEAERQTSFQLQMVVTMKLAPRSQEIHLSARWGGHQH